jgi:hypothetical protein
VAIIWPNILYAHNGGAIELPSEFSDASLLALARQF